MQEHTEYIFSIQAKNGGFFIKREGGVHNIVVIIRGARAVGAASQ